jgi:hypothetical protein
MTKQVWSRPEASRFPIKSVTRGLGGFGTDDAGQAS